MKGPSNLNTLSLRHVYYGWVPRVYCEMWNVSGGCEGERIEHDLTNHLKDGQGNCILTFERYSKIVKDYAKKKTKL